MTSAVRAEDFEGFVSHNLSLVFIIIVSFLVGHSFPYIVSKERSLYLHVFSKRRIVFGALFALLGLYVGVDLKIHSFWYACVGYECGLLFGMLVYSFIDEALSVYTEMSLTLFAFVLANGVGGAFIGAFYAEVVRGTALHVAALTLALSSGVCVLLTIALTLAVHALDSRSGARRRGSAPLPPLRVPHL